tara:strand:- start:590 stop:727 length:138 start_codon:yes stop_codon:yes gene_type:complete
LLLYPQWVILTLGIEEASSLKLKTKAKKTKQTQKSLTNKESKKQA